MEEINSNGIHPQPSTPGPCHMLSQKLHYLMATVTFRGGPYLNPCLQVKKLMLMEGK